MNGILDKVYVLPGIIIGLTIHEFMHAFVAYKLGDDTAQKQGRLTFNPMVHIDPIGFIFLIVFGFGWAKPVSFNSNKLKNPARDEILIALAGPFANLVFAICIAVIIKLLVLVKFSIGSYTFIVSTLLNEAFYINIVLFVFNLIPIPPLDGSHLLCKALRLSPTSEMKFFQYGQYVLFAAIILDQVTNGRILHLSFFMNMTAQFIYSIIPI